MKKLQNRISKIFNSLIKQLDFQNDIENITTKWVCSEKPT
jgi:hypothetical protein